MPPTPKPQAQTAADKENWSTQIPEALERLGVWAVLDRLESARAQAPEDLRVRGYYEIVRNLIVRDFLAAPNGMDTVPRLTREFLSDYGRFNLSAQEGFLVSLIDGRLSVAKILQVSPFESFTTIFHLARLQSQGAITR